MPAKGSIGKYYGRHVFLATSFGKSMLNKQDPLYLTAILKGVSGEYGRNQEVGT